MTTVTAKRRAIFQYDGSFDGFLSVIFTIYQQKTEPLAINRAGQFQEDFFTSVNRVETDIALAERVWAGLRKKLSAEALNNIFQTFLSEVAEVELLLFRYIKLVLGSNACMEQNYADANVLEVIKLGRRVWREKHRMEAFVRFRKMADGTFLALISPDFNVLPLISDHFEQRYADQCWVIFDQKRHYGLHYDLEKVAEIHLGHSNLPINEPSLKSVETDQAEVQFQELWKCYFASVNIPERRNPKLHLRHLPKRYWRYLPEKTLHPKPTSPGFRLK